MKNRSAGEVCGWVSERDRLCSSLLTVCARARVALRSSSLKRAALMARVAMYCLLLASRASLLGTAMGGSLNDERPFLLLGPAVSSKRARSGILGFLTFSGLSSRSSSKSDPLSSSELAAFSKSIKSSPLLSPNSSGSELTFFFFLAGESDL